MLLLHTLGRLQLVESDAPEVPLFTGPKPLLLLAYLGIDGPANRRHLGELFFSGHADQLDSVSATLRRLRRISESLIISVGSEVRTTARCDYVELMEAVLSHAPGQATSMYEGSFLKGCNLSAYGTEFEEWAYQHRTSIAESLRSSLLDQAEASCANLRLDEAGSLAEQAYLLPGADEPEPELLARLHNVFVATNHPLEPDARAEALRFGVQELSATPAVALAETNPDRGAATVPGNLPLPLRSFIGRDSEIIELIGMLRRTDVRLLTLQGVGGSGKSQLALEVARQLVDDIRFKNGVYVVRLESVTDHRLVPMVIANTLGMTLQGSASQLDQLRTFIGRNQQLLILDNFEHLMEAADVTRSLLEFCPGLKLIVTSRERLGTEPEHPITVDGLRYPELEAGLNAALPSEAVQLFIRRAQKYDRGFILTEENVEAVLRICSSVSGLPLGLELAATWIEHMSVAEIAREAERAPGNLETHLRDAPDRHRSLRATLNHTWDLLTHAERIVLQELTIFRGGFRHDAAQAVLDTTLPKLARLVHKSLLRISSQRYSPHPLLHQYAREQLELEPEKLAQLREKHALHYLQFLSQRTDRIIGGHGVSVAVTELEEERANIGGAWRWAIEMRRYDWLLDAFEGLTHFAEVTSSQVWVIALFREATAMLLETDAATRHVVATLTATLPILMYRIDDNEVGLRHALEAARELRRSEPGERNPGMWSALYGTGLTSMLLGNYDSDDFEQSVQLAQLDLQRSVAANASPDSIRRSEVLLGISLTGAGMNLVLAGDLERAQTYLDQARHRLDSMQSPYTSFYCWVQHDACLAGGRADEAERWARKGFDLTKTQKYVTQEARLGLCLARLNFLAGNAEAARSHAVRVHDLLVLSDDGFVRAPLETLEGWMALAAGRPEAARASFLEAIKIGASINVRINIMEPLLGLVQILAQSSHQSTAYRIAGFLAGTEQLPAALRGPVQATLDQLKNSRADGSALSGQGRALSLDDVLELVHAATGTDFRLGNLNGSFPH